MQNLCYPRPQLRRREWLSLDGEWKFAFDDELRHRVPSSIKHWPLRIEVPYAPECTRSGIGDTNFHQACWYEREFELTQDKLAEGSRVLLHFGAVDYQARVWVN